MTKSIQARASVVALTLALASAEASFGQSIDELFPPVPVEELLKMRLTEKEFSAPATEQELVETPPPEIEPEAEEAPPKVVFVEVQMIQVPNAKVSALVRELRDAQKRPAALKALDDMVTQGSARVVGWPMLTTISDQRSVVESINEFRYATAFAPGEVRLGPAFQNPAQAVPNQLGGEESKPVPTDFEIRNVGVTLEAEPMVESPDDVISLNLVPQHVRLKAMRKVKIERLERKDTVVVEQPEFETMKVTTSIRIKSGDRMLLAMFPMSEPPDHTELFIVGAEIIPDQNLPVVPPEKATHDSARQPK